MQEWSCVFMAPSIMDPCDFRNARSNNERASAAMSSMIHLEEVSRWLLRAKNLLNAHRGARRAALWYYGTIAGGWHILAAAHSQTKTVSTQNKPTNTSTSDTGSDASDTRSEPRTPTGQPPAA